MTSRYKKSILNLLYLLHESRKKPFEEVKKWLVLQEKIISKLIYLENRIKACKTEIKALNINRKNSKVRLSKEESLIVKNRLKILKFHIEEYHWIISIIKSVGDGIAFTFINKLDIKPQNFKESPGFISGKKGLIIEKKMLRYSFKNNIIAILNDLTSVLRYADLTLITNSGYLPIEAKTSNMSNTRIKRQEDKAKKLYKYLNEDTTTDLYGDGQVMKRVETQSPEKNYINKFNNLIKSASEKGYDFEKFENGVVCLVAFKEIGSSVFDKVTKKQGLIEAFPFHLNMYKFEELGYYPFSLSFNNPEFYWEFLKGNLNVIIFIDFAQIKEISLRNGFSITRSKEENMAFNFKSLNPNTENFEFKMSEHYFSRSYMEFVSVEWLMQDTFDIFKNKISEIKRL